MPLTPKNRKEEWLQGLVDHETTLTPKNRPEEWMKEIIDASGGGGGGGGGMLKVNMAWSEDYSSCTLDKTYAELLSAFQDGFVISIVEDTGVFSLLIVCEVGYINDTYGVILLPMYNLQGGPMSFTAETENSYPVWTE